MSVVINGSDGVDSSGKLQSGGDPNDGTAVGAKMLQSGVVQAARASGASAVYMGFTQGSSTATSRINGDGSALFGTDYKVKIRPFNGANADQFQILDTSDAVTASITGGGSAVFNGVLTGNQRVVVNQAGTKTGAAATLLNYAGDGSTVTASIDANGLIYTASGISFGSFSSPVTTKTFDDYEEGTFEPIYTSSDGDFTAATYHADTGGRYVKIGNYVWATGCARLNNDSTLNTSNRSNGATLRIGGLPFVNESRSNGDNSDSPNAVRTPVWSSGASAPNFIALSPNTDTANLFFIGAIGAVASVNTVSQLGMSSMVQFTVTYTTAD